MEDSTRRFSLAMMIVPACRLGTAKPVPVFYLFAACAVLGIRRIISAAAIAETIIRTRPDEKDPVRVFR